MSKKKIREDFRNSVFDRDGHKCKMCGNPKAKLDAHHITDRSLMPNGGYVKENGIYLCEDLHTSYWLGYGGGHKRRGTFIEFSKNFIDYLNANHSEQRSLRTNTFTNSVNSIHYYDSIIVIEKRKKEKSFHEKIGEMSFPPPPGKSSAQKIRLRIINGFNKRINGILRFFRLKGYSWK